MDPNGKGQLWRGGAGLVACLLLGWIGVVREGPVPGLWLVDLGFHELGHLLAAPLPNLATAVAGSVLQVLVPLGLAAYFLIRQRDAVAAGLCAAWAGTSAQNVAVYIADAPYQLLDLIGGEHDWAYILAMRGELDRAAGMAAGVRAGAFLLVGIGIAACVWSLLRRPPVEEAWEAAQPTQETFVAWEE